MRAFDRSCSNHPNVYYVDNPLTFFDPENEFEKGVRIKVV